MNASTDTSVPPRTRAAPPPSGARVAADIRGPGA